MLLGGFQPIGQRVSAFISRLCVNDVINTVVGDVQLLKMLVVTCLCVSFIYITDSNLRLVRGVCHMTAL